MSHTGSPPPLVHRLALPAGTERVEGVFVNGVPLREEGYAVHGDHLWIDAGVRPAAPLSRRGMLMIALCVDVVPEGDTIDVLVVRDGRLVSVQPTMG